jgi:hypothetical protein
MTHQNFRRNGFTACDFSAQSFNLGNTDALFRNDPLTAEFVPEDTAAERHEFVSVSWAIQRDVVLPVQIECY